jgi:tRNA threonylcarbamoyladenosine biosynthesis protein TsaB
MWRFKTLAYKWQLGYYVRPMVTQKRTIAIETSGLVGSVAAGMDDRLLAEQTFSARLCHNSELLGTIDSLCKRLGWRAGDIERLYVSAGPGSFTGIRIAVTMAKVIAFAQNTIIVAVPSIEAQVLNAGQAMRNGNPDMKNQHVAVILEAGRGQIFSAVFRENGAGSNQLVPGFDTVIEQQSLTPEQLLSLSPRPLYVLGEGLNYHKKEFQSDSQVVWLDKEYWNPLARNVLRCGYLREKAGLFVGAAGQETVDTLVPIYLRRPDIVAKWQQLHG